MVYRIFHLDDKGRVRDARVIECVDDAEAIRIFDRCTSDRPMQLWHLARCIKAYSPKGADVQAPSAVKAE